MPSEDGLAQLTDAEREQLEAFLAQRRADAEESNSRYTAMSAASWLATLAKSIKEGQQLRPEQADAIWQGMTEVAKSLRKAGYAKPKISRKAKAVPTPKHRRKPRRARDRHRARQKSPTPEQSPPESHAHPRPRPAPTQWKVANHESTGIVRIG